MQLHIPILNRAQRAQIRIAFNRIPENVTDAGAVRAELHLRAGREHRLHRRKFFQHATARPIQFRGLFKNDVDERHPEHRLRADGMHLRHALQRRHQRKRDLIFHQLRRAAHPFREDDDLIFRQVGNRIKRRVLHRPNAPADDDRVEENDDEFIAGAIVDDLFDHSLISLSCKNLFLRVTFFIQQSSVPIIP
ncbi:MAG: hypothetical protein ALAOOOJD_03873 [bacterium]|nr:hypothetical protein [bacterium]